MLYNGIIYRMVAPIYIIVMLFLAIFLVALSKLIRALANGVDTHIDRVQTKLVELELKSNMEAKK